MPELAATLVGMGAALGVGGAVIVVATLLGRLVVARLARRERDDLTAVADTVLVDQSQVDARFDAIAEMEPDVTALGRAIAADLYCTEEDL